MRFSVRRIFLFTALVAICLFFWLNPYLLIESPGLRYQRLRENSDLCEALEKQVRNGDNYSRVSTILGPGNRYSLSDKNDFIGKVSRYGKAQESFLDDFEFDEDDEIVSYRSNRSQAFLLIFRDGKLVNHDPQRYDAD